MDKKTPHLYKNDREDISSRWFPLCEDMTFFEAKEKGFLALIMTYLGLFKKYLPFQRGLNFFLADE